MYAHEIIVIKIPTSKQMTFNNNSIIVSTIINHNSNNNNYSIIDNNGNHSIACTTKFTIFIKS